VERVLAYFHDHKFPWYWNVKLETKSLIIRQNHLVVGEVNLQLCVRHFSAFGYLFRTKSSTAQYRNAFGTSIIWRSFGYQPAG